MTCAAGVWRPFRRPGAGHGCTVKRAKLSLSQCHLSVQVLVLKAVFIRFGWLCLLIRWLMSDHLLIRLTDMQLFLIQIREKWRFKQQGQQMATFSPLITIKPRCCYAWCVYLLSQQMDFQSCILLQFLKLLNAYSIFFLFFKLWNNSVRALILKCKAIRCFTYLDKWRPVHWLDLNKQCD